MCGWLVTAFLVPPRSQRPGQGPRSPHPKVDPDCQYNLTYNSSEQLSGFSSRFPSSRKLSRSMSLTVGYGKPPEKQISVTGIYTLLFFLKKWTGSLNWKSKSSLCAWAIKWVKPMYIRYFCNLHHHASFQNSYSKWQSVLTNKFLTFTVLWLGYWPLKEMKRCGTGVPFTSRVHWKCGNWIKYLKLETHAHTHDCKYAHTHTHTHTHTQCAGLINLIFTSLAVNWQTGQCCPIKCTYFSYEREKTLSQWAITLKIVLHEAETWYLQGCELKFCKQTRLKWNTYLSFG
jgi:hypothetical protein